MSCHIMNSVSEEISDYSLRLMLPKFSKGHKLKFFYPFIEKHIGFENVSSFGQLSFPNQFQIVLKSKEIRAELLKMSITKIESRSCWIVPVSNREIVGYVHWLPETVSNEQIQELLSKHGEVLFVRNKESFDPLPSNIRHFAIKLREGVNVDDVEHFVKLNDHRGWIQVTGRKTAACFHCEKTGHVKKHCKMFRKKVNFYCKRLQRGKRFSAKVNEVVKETSKLKMKNEFETKDEGWND